MKHKPVLMKAIQNEKLETAKREQERLKALEREKKESEIKAIEKQIAVSDEQIAVTTDYKKGRDSPSKEVVHRPKKSNPIITLFEVLFRILTLIVNLLISFLESFQWIVVSVIVTIAIIIILNYSGVDVGELIDKGLELFQKGGK